MANVNRVCKLAIKYKWRIRTVVIENIVGWKISENGNVLSYTTLKGSGAISLKNFVSLEYIERCLTAHFQKMFCRPAIHRKTLYISNVTAKWG